MEILETLARADGATGWTTMIGSESPLLLALLPRTVYAFYERAPELWGLSHLADQQIAGVTMAVEQAVVFFAVFVALLTRHLGEEERREQWRSA